MQAVAGCGLRDCTRALHIPEYMALQLAGAVEFVFKNGRADAIARAGDLNEGAAGRS